MTDRERILEATRGRCKISRSHLVRFYRCDPDTIQATLADMIAEGIIEINDRGQYWRPSSRPMGISLDAMSSGYKESDDWQKNRE